MANDAHGVSSVLCEYATAPATILVAASPTESLATALDAVEAYVTAADEPEAAYVWLPLLSLSQHRGRSSLAAGNGCRSASFRSHSGLSHSGSYHSFPNPASARASSLNGGLRTPRKCAHNG